MYIILGSVEKTPQNVKKRSLTPKNKLSTSKKSGSKSSPSQHSESIEIYGCSIPATLILHSRDFVSCVTEWDRSMPMTETGWTTLNVLGRGLGKNLTNLYPNGKLLGESLEHMLDYFSVNGLIRASECFQYYYPLLNKLKSSSSEGKKKNDGKDNRRNDENSTPLPSRKRSSSPITRKELRRVGKPKTPLPTRKRSPSPAMEKTHRRNDDINGAQELFLSGQKPTTVSEAKARGKTNTKFPQPGDIGELNIQ